MASWTKARPRARTWANVTWIKLQVSKVPQTRFCWLCRVCPPIFKSKTPKPGKPVPWKRPTENANAKSPKMSSQSNFLQPYNMREWTFSRSSALFQSQQIMAWTFSFFAAGAFPGKTFPPLGSQLANCSPGKPGQQVVLPFVKLAKSSPSWNHALITKGTYYTYKVSTSWTENYIKSQISFWDPWTFQEFCPQKKTPRISGGFCSHG